MSKSEVYIGERVKELYFDTPVQVTFTESWNEGRKYSGIAFCGEVIAADDGTAVSMEDIIYLKTLPWIDFSDAIKEEDENESIR